ncbi:hypothetical protein FACS1894110_25490 [Spirochaetia bacterium]|nr:hypothetical protein FACS1894110_25490 [Spirochaetia bacterium]
MKNRSLFFGIVGIVLAIGLIFTGCPDPGASEPGPAGPQGPGGAGVDTTELATFGYSFGTPVHSRYGRTAVYANEYISDKNISASVDSGTYVVTFENGNKTVTTTIPTTVITQTALVAALDAAAGLVDLKVEASGNFVKVSKLTPDSTRPFVIKGTNAHLLKLFLASGGNTSLGPAVIRSELKDEWILPLVAVDGGAASLVVSAGSQVNLGGKFYPVPAGSDDADIAAAVTALGVTGYTPEAYTPADGAVVFTADSFGPKATSASAFKPTVTANADLRDYGYTFVVTPPSIPGVAAKADGHNGTKSSITGNVNISGGVAITADWKLKVTVGGTKEYHIILPAVASGADSTNQLAAINAGLAGSGVTAKETATFLQFEADAVGTTTVAVTGDAAALSALVGTQTPATGTAPTNRSAGPETWSITVIGGSAAGAADLSPTVASKVTIAGKGPTTIAAYRTALGAANTIVTDLVTGIADVSTNFENAIRNGSNGRIDIVQKTANAGTGNLSGITWTISAP